MSGALLGLSLLIIGDSHLSSADSLIKSLPDALVAEGATVTTYGVCGSLAGDWVTGRRNASCGSNSRINDAPVSQPVMDHAPTPSVAGLLEQHHPDAIVIVLGDTMANYNKDTLYHPWVSQQITALTKVIAAARTPCYWVGPPWGEETPRYRKTDARAQEVAAILDRDLAVLLHQFAADDHPGNLDDPGRHAPDGRKLRPLGAQHRCLTLSGAERSCGQSR